MPITGYPEPPSGVNNNTSVALWGPGWPACQDNRQTWIYLTNGVGLRVRKEIADLVRRLLNECLRRGYWIRDPDSAGFVCRAIAHTLIPSNHSWGLAVDINWQSNPQGTHTTNIPVWMVQLMWSYHFYWGGWYDDPDPMHFEYVGTPTQAAADAARALKTFGGTQVAEKVELVDATNNALSEVWNAEKAMRDGKPVDANKTYPGGPHWLVEKTKALEVKINDLNAKVTTLTTKVDQLLAAGGVDAALIRSVLVEVLADVKLTVGQ